MPAQASIAAQALPIGLATDTQAWQVRNALLREFGCEKGTEGFN